MTGSGWGIGVYPEAMPMAQLAGPSERVCFRRTRLLSHTGPRLFSHIGRWSPGGLVWAGAVTRRELGGATRAFLLAWTFCFVMM